MAGRPAHDYVEGVRDRTQAELRREVLGMRADDVTGCGVPNIAGMKIKRVRAGRIQVGFEGGADRVADIVKAKGQAAATGKEVEDARSFPSPATA